MKFLLVPLGNPGTKYEDTRHNAGRFVYEKLKEKIKNTFSEEVKVYIPDCYMNETGEYLKKYLKNKNILKENLIVIYDDKDLEIGDVRLSAMRGDGGHNGLKSIIHELETKNFFRIRIGIAPIGTGKNNIIPPHGEVVQKYVLAKMKTEEKDILSSEKVLDRVQIFLEQILNGK